VANGRTAWNRKEASGLKHAESGIRLHVADAMSVVDGGKEPYRLVLFLSESVAWLFDKNFVNSSVSSGISG
jgi:hypothetical protein